MAESVPVRCPVCGRERLYAPPTYPCPCGSAVPVPLLREGAPVRVLHRLWDQSWVTLRCAACGRDGEWPRPELSCACGAALCPPLADRPGVAPGPQAGIASSAVSHAVRPAAPTRPAFRPVTIRTARDAVAAAARYLEWLGFARVRRTGTGPASGIDLRGPEVLARVDPTTAPTGLRAVETLWLHGLNEAAVAVCFSLAGYAPDARHRADELRLPLFVLDLAGTPRPVNGAAAELVRTGETP